MKLPLWKSILFATVLTCAGLAALEGVLSLLGVRPAVVERDPYVGFASRVPLFVADGVDRAGRQIMRTAENKKRFFNDQSFVQPKPNGTYRIFCPGESTTYGHPYRDPTSFPGWLRSYLRETEPDRLWDVINAGGISYASHRLAALMEELVRYEPDLFVLYVGHNEFLEDRTYAAVRDESPLRRWWMTRLFRTRAATLVLRARDRVSARVDDSKGEVHTLLDDSIGPAAYHRDLQRQDAVVSQYAGNLRRMVRLARSVGADVVMVTPASSLRDCSPFKSESSTGLTPGDASKASSLRSEGRASIREESFESAVASLDEAVRLDPDHAEGRYLLAEALQRIGRTEEAHTHYLAAKDKDIVPVRAISRLVEKAREVAAELDVPLIDYVDMLESRTRTELGHDSPGSELFLDHVHPTIDGNRMLAEALFEVLKKSGVVASNIDASVRARVQASVEGTIDQREQGLALRNVAKVYSWAGKTDDAARLAVQASAKLGPDAECNFIEGMAAQERGDWHAAEGLYRAAVALEPTYVKALHNHGIALANLDRIEESLKAYDAVLALDPDHPYVRYNRAYALYRGHRDDEALAAFREVLEEQPEDADARFYVDELTRTNR